LLARLRYQIVEAFDRKTARNNEHKRLLGGERDRRKIALWVETGAPIQDRLAH
jgi:hypothetical protein